MKSLIFVFVETGESGHVQINNGGSEKINNLNKIEVEMFLNTKKQSSLKFSLIEKLIEDTVLAAPVVFKSF